MKTRLRNRNKNIKVFINYLLTDEISTFITGTKSLQLLPIETCIPPDSRI